MRKFTLKKVHVLILFMGIIFNFLGIFHTAVWFDEAYSVGLASQSFEKIWNIGGHDVHPVLYYWILHAINIVFGGNFLYYRIFSALCIAVLGLLGYTHIRKDFGEKTGCLFTFFALFLPVSPLFANEIRMYSLAVALVTILAIYAYRIYKGETAWKNWIIFGLTSLACIYTHYYGLMAAGIINILMLIKFMKYGRIESIKRIIGFGVAQLILYIPWLLYFITQLKQVSKGFWIGFDFPQSLFDITSFQIIGRFNSYIGFALAMLLYIYIGIKIYKLKKSGENILPVKLSIGLYLAIIVAALGVTVCARTMLLYYRYLFVVTGLYIFTLSFVLSKESRKWVIGLICTVIIALSTFTNVKMIKANYDKENIKPMDYLKINVLPEDTIVFTDKDGGLGAAVAVNFTNNRSILYNGNNWGVEEAYKAFGPKFETHVNKDFLQSLNGRVWIIEGDNDEGKKLFDSEKITIRAVKEFRTSYQNYCYKITLIEVNN